MTNEAIIFWGLWQDKQDFPDLYRTKSFALKTMKERAKKNPGIKIHLMKIESMGTMFLPDKLEIEGEIKIPDRISQDVVK